MNHHEKSSLLKWHLHVPTILVMLYQRKIISSLTHTQNGNYSLNIPIEFSKMLNILFCVVNYSFQNIPNLFGQPVVCLLSPERAPPTMQGQLSTKGPLFEYTWKCM